MKKVKIGMHNAPRNQMHAVPPPFFMSSNLQDIAAQLQVFASLEQYLQKFLLAPPEKQQDEQELDKVGPNSSVAVLGPFSAH
jgi:hypothetical protein